MMLIETADQSPTRWRSAGGRAVAAVGLVLGLAVTACAGPQHPGPDSGPGARAATVADLHTVVSQPRALGPAQAHELRSCLRRHGFDPPLPAVDVGQTANLPVFLTESAARRTGYGPAITEARQLGSDVLGHYAQSLPPSEQATFATALDDGAGPRVEFATPNGWVVRASTAGCMAAARTAVYGSVENWLLAYALPQDLNATAADVYLEPPVAAALEAYQRCMTDEGQSAAFPQEAFAAARAAAGPEARAVEVRIATADARCQARTDLAATVRTAFERLAMPWAARNADLLAKAAAVVDAATARHAPHDR